MPERDVRSGVTEPIRAFAVRNAAWLLPLAFAVLVTLLGQWWSPQAFDADEGINLGKGALVAAGFDPYAEIWNDQPPVLTYILAAVQDVFPWSVGAARVTILVFACLLLHAVFRLVERSAGRAEAVTAVVLLGTAPLMWRLSISVMIGLPAIALAVAACDIAYRRDRAELWRAVVAGLVFALSLQTKLFTAAALPAFLLVAYLAGDGVTRGRRVGMAATALAAMAGGFVAIALVSGEPFLSQLVTPHVAREVRSDYSLIATAGHFAEFLVQQPFVLAAALLAATSVGRPSSRLRTAWLAWIGVTVVVLLGHTPLRYHHLLLLVVPMACLGGEALWRVLKVAWPHRHGLARHGIALAVIVPVVAVAYLVLLLRPFHDDPTPGVNEAAERLAAYAGLDPWVATDQPFDAFAAGLLVPPELVVFSIKRIETHNLTPEMLVAVLAARQPGQVMLRRAHADRTVRDYLDRHYVRVDPSRLHYVRPDLAGGNASLTGRRPGVYPVAASSLYLPSGRGQHALPGQVDLDHVDVAVLVVGEIDGATGPGRALGHLGDVELEAVGQVDPRPVLGAGDWIGNRPGLGLDHARYRDPPLAGLHIHSEVDRLVEGVELGRRHHRKHPPHRRHLLGVLAGHDPVEGVPLLGRGAFVDDDLHGAIALVDRTRPFHHQRSPCPAEIDITIVAGVELESGHGLAAAVGRQGHELAGATGGAVAVGQFPSVQLPLCHPNSPLFLRRTCASETITNRDLCPTQIDIATGSGQSTAGACTNSMHFEPGNRA